MKRAEALKGIGFAAVAGLVLSPLLLLAGEVAFAEVRLAETFGGALFAVAFFSSTALTVAFYQDSISLQRAVLTSYAVKTLVVFMGVMSFSFHGVDQYVVAASITLSAFSYLIVQTTYIAGRKGRMKRRIERLQ